MIIEFKRRFYYFILGILGFVTASCDKKPIMDMYGVPYVNAKMSGKVTDKDNDPIEGIKVQSSYSQQTFTSADGSYEISDNRYMTQYLIFTDIDGAENGGEFAEQSIEVKFTEADRTGKGDGSWYGGSFERTDVNVEMEEVSK